MRRKALSFYQAQDIRELYRTGQYTQLQISGQYGVLAKTISQICNNETLTGAPRKKPVQSAEAEVTHKGLACYTKVLTDSGWKRADEVVLTDNLVAVDGTYTSILAIYPDEEQPMIRLNFEDKLWVTTAADHRWLTLDQKTGWKEGWKLRTSSRLTEGEAVQGTHTCQGIPGTPYDGEDPYVIGLLLGDGCTVPGIECTTLYNKDEFILNYMIENFDWRYYKYGDQVARVVATCRGESEYWKKLVGKSKAHFKSVPQYLLEADRDTRLAVLQGLCDTDGCADKDGRVSFSSTSTHLTEAVCYIVRSLGGKAMWHIDNREKKTSRGGGQIFDTRITPCNKFVPFRLPRKIERCKRMKGVHMMIRSTEPAPPSASVGFAIAHESHQFIIKDFLVAHDVTGSPIMRKFPVKKIASESV